ncbi:MAG: ribonuclease E inhibitor RraB [Frankiales bacterium]|nr:ribonuclease E inhibitor RraB [Frankiales bacterium]
MSLLDRLRRRRSPAPVVLDPDDPSLVVLVEAFEAARADSAVLADAAGRGVNLDQPLLMRHHLVGLTGASIVERAAELLGQDGYTLHDLGGGAVLATRTQRLTALSASQERSRMAGLAQRLGGDVVGWDALGPDAPA